MFDFDPAKSAANKAKHGIDFEEAQALWDDRDLMVIVSGQAHNGEARLLAIGTMQEKMWTAVVTQRAHTTRIISVRRARRYEELAYEQARQARR